jgi:hypothetical protein
VLPVKGIPRLAIVFVIGKIDAVAAPVLLPKMDGIDNPTPPALVDVALVAVVAIVDKTLFEIVYSLS